MLNNRPLKKHTSTRLGATKRNLSIRKNNRKLRDIRNQLIEVSLIKNADKRTKQG